MKLSDRIEKVVHPFAGFPADLDNLLDNLFAGQRDQVVSDFLPRANVFETETEFTLSLELPGVDSTDISVEVADGQLTISGEKRPETGPENATSHRVERSHGRFERRFEFPTQVDFDKIEAASKNGVLIVKVPKSEKVLPRRIDIKVNR